MEHSDALLLLQTEGVLLRPWVLMELFAAVNHHVPIIPILLHGAGYSFDAAKATLADLPAALSARNPGALRLLEQLAEDAGASVEQIGAALGGILPNIIAVDFNPRGTDNHVHAAVADIVNKLRHHAVVLRSGRRTASR